jgi:hypothetical protein
MASTQDSAEILEATNEMESRAMKDNEKTEASASLRGVKFRNLSNDALVKIFLTLCIFGTICYAFYSIQQLAVKVEKVETEIDETIDDKLHEDVIRKLIEETRQQ